MSFKMAMVGNGNLQNCRFQHEQQEERQSAGIRIEQLEDTLNIFQKLWTETSPVSYAGKHYKITDAWCEPKPDPMIPIK